MMMNGRSNGKTCAFIKYISENNIRVITDTIDTAEKIIKSAEECKMNILEPMLYKDFLRNGCKDITMYVTRVNKPQLNGLIAYEV